MINLLKNIIFIAIILALGYIGYVVFPTMIYLITPEEELYSLQNTVDMCKYPGRFYADGSCNNSDPCDPNTLKDPILRGDCPKGVVSDEPASITYDEIGK